MTADYPNHPSEADICAALGALPDGWYFTRDLLPTYVAWAKENNRPEPTVKTLGEAIGIRVCLDSRKSKGSTRWHVTKRGLECRNWYEEK